MKRRYFALILFFLLALLLVGCGGKDEVYYTVSFDSAGGTEVAAQRVKAGDTATYPAKPLRSGYTFQGWLLDGKAYTFREPVSADITLVASYKSELTVGALIGLWRGSETVDGVTYRYEVTLDDGAGSLSYTVVSGTDGGATTVLTVASTSVRDGRLVIEYAGGEPSSTLLDYVDGRLVGKGIFGGELTLTRQATVTVTYHHYGGGTSTERFVDGEGFRVIPCALPSGLSFDGWYTTDGDILSEGDSIAGIKDVYANAYTTGLTFDGNTVTAYDGDSSTVMIPSRFGGQAITAVGESAFENAALAEITIPEGITEIADRAFYGCSALGALRLPKSLKSIGEYAFYDCISIPEINLPDGVTRIGFAAFGATLGAVELEEGGIAIFSSNTALTSVSVPFIGGGTDETSFFAYIFGAKSPEDNWIDSDGREYTLGEESGVASIYYVLPVTLASVEVRNISAVPEKAFYSCIYLEQIALEGSVSEIGDSAFEACVNADVLGVSMVEHIGDRAFLNSEFDGSIFHVLESIGEYAFGYSAITEIYFPATLTYIGDAAFVFTGLSEITFPASVTYVGDNAFWGCNSLTRATFLGEEAPTIGSDIFTVAEEDAIYYTDILIFVPGTTAAGQPYESYRSDLYLRNYASGIFPESVKGDTGYIVSGDILLGYVPEDGEELTAVNPPEGVRSIADFAFYNCGYITEINLPEGFERIGKYAFYGCTSVAYLNMPSTMREIDDYAFTGFFVGNNITRLYFPEGFTRIGEGAFMSSFNLRIVELPSTLEYVGYLAFGMANSLERISFGSATPPTVGTYENDAGEPATEIFQIINTGKLAVYVPAGKASVYKNAAGFSNVANYIKVKPEGEEVGRYGNANYFVELDGGGTATISTIVPADEDTSSMGGTKYIYDSVEGSYVIDGNMITIVTEKYGTIDGLFASGVRRMMLTINGSNELLTEPRVYYDDYNWTTFKLYEDGSGVFDMYGSFLTPFKWTIDGENFNLTIDGNNKLPENADYAGERLYVGSYDATSDSFSIEFMLNDYSTALEADLTEILYSTGEATRLYGRYVAYSANGYAMLTVESYGNGTCDFYIGESKYEGCAYTITDGVVTISVTLLEVELTLDANGRLYGGNELTGIDMLFVFVDELMDSTKMPD